MVNKRKLILVFSLILIFSLFLSISFVSANIFSDFFNNLFEKNQVDLSPQSCQNDWECPVGQNCNTGYCGTPINCDPEVSIVSNPLCPAQDVCNPETSECQQGECQKNSDCTNKFNVCENSLCAVKLCSIDSDCPIYNDNPKCLAGVCVQPMCDTNFSICGTNPNNPGVCFNYLCLKKQCSINADCPSGRVCNNGLCFKKECITDVNCIDSKVCSEDKCVTKSCTNDNDCSTSADGTIRICWNNICQQPECDYDKETCSSDQICIGNKCETKQSCGAGALCPNPTDWFCAEEVCKPLTCGETQKCALGNACVNGRCVIDLKSFCYNGQQDSESHETGIDCGGVCKACPCTPQCSGKSCGSWNDGCGGTINCGVCSSGQTCNSNGQCITIQQCTPSCSGKTCGASNGCGGTCQSGSGCRVCTNPKRC